MTYRPSPTPMRHASDDTYIARVAFIEPLNQPLHQTEPAGSDDDGQTHPANDDPEI